jgi:hypothetical protein
MLSLREIRRRLKDRRIYVISEATGLHHQTIAAIRDGRHKDPRHDTVLKLSDYFEEADRVQHPRRAVKA